jgi:hypothetical protein
MMHVWRVLLLCPWLLVLFGVFEGFFYARLAVMSSSAPAQAGAAGVALCWAVLPYVLARALELAFKPWPERSWFASQRGPTPEELRAAVEAELDRRLRLQDHHPPSRP